MLFPWTCHKKWAKRYGIQVKEFPCPLCREVIEFDIPFALRGSRGLGASPCRRCGWTAGYYVMVPYQRKKAPS